MESTLINWVNTFEQISKPCSCFADLSDGIILSELLAQVIPKYLDPSSIKREAEGNQYLKQTNVKRIISVLESFHQQELGLDGVVHIEPNAVTQGDSKEIQKLIQVILGVVVQSEDKILYIPKMQSLAPEDQKELIVLIDGIMHQQAALKKDKTITKSPSEEDDFLNELDAQQRNMEKEKLALQYELEKIKHEYSIASSEISNLQNKNQVLISEVKRLETELEKSREETERIAAMESSVDESFEARRVDTSTEINERHKFLVEIDERDRNIAELRKKVEELSKYAQESRKLRDEMDMLREEASKVADLEERVKKLQVKSETVPDLKKQIKALEEQNDKYLKTNLELEDSSRKIPILKTQLDKYKEQVASLTASQNNLNNTIHEKEEEVSRIKSDMERVLDECKTKKNQVERLESQLEILKQEKEAAMFSSSLANDSFVEDGLTVSDLTLKEKMARLELENKKLKAGDGIDKVHELEDKLDDTNRLVEKYLQENESLKKQIKEISANGKSAPVVVVDDQKELTELKDLKATYQTLLDEHEATLVLIKKLEGENKKGMEEINSLLKDKAILSDVNAKLKIAQEKITTITAEKTKLEGYLRTAKSMIREERAKSKESQDGELHKIHKQYEDAINVLKNQLKEKEKELAHYKNLLEDSKDSSARELKLMSSAVYEFGLELQRLKAPKPDLSTIQPKSLLAQKRSEIEKK